MCGIRPMQSVSVGCGDYITVNNRVIQHSGLLWPGKAGVHSPQHLLLLLFIAGSKNLGRST